MIVVMIISIGTGRFKESVLMFVEEELGHHVAYIVWLRHCLVRNIHKLAGVEVEDDVHAGILTPSWIYVCKEVCVGYLLYFSYSCHCGECFWVYDVNIGL